MHRIWALKFIAALTTRLGAEGILPYLNQIMQPLYRIQESGSAPNTDEVGGCFLEGMQQFNFVRSSERSCALHGCLLPVI